MNELCEEHIAAAVSYMVKKFQGHQFSDDAIDIAIDTFEENIGPAFLKNGFSRQLAHQMAVEATRQVAQHLKNKTRIH